MKNTTESARHLMQLGDILEEYADAVRDYCNGNAATLDAAYDVASYLKRYYGLFCQVRGLYHNSEPTAVFYAGEGAWKRGAAPVFEIPCY